MLAKYHNNLECGIRKIGQIEEGIKIKENNSR